MNSQKKADQYTRDLQSQVSVLMKQIATRNGFLRYYIKILPRCKSQKSAFDIVNLLYYLVFDEEMFSSYDAFRWHKNKGLKK